MLKTIRKTQWGETGRERDRDMDKGRNLRSQERIGVCSTNVENLPSFLPSFLPSSLPSFLPSFVSLFHSVNREKVRGWIHIALNLQVRLRAVENIHI